MFSDSHHQKRTVTYTSVYILLFSQSQLNRQLGFRTGHQESKKANKNVLDECQHNKKLSLACHKQKKRLNQSKKSLFNQLHFRRKICTQ